MAHRICCASTSFSRHQVAASAAALQRQRGASISYLRHSSAQSQHAATPQWAHVCGRHENCVRVSCKTSSRQSASITPGHAQPQKVALIFELDGAVVDLQSDAHRVAFNEAFVDLGFDCVQWSVPIYNDLLSSGDGSAEGMIFVYFNTMGWPMMLATSDQDTFVRKVHEGKRKAFLRLLKNDEVPLRPDVQEVINQAVNDGAVVAFLTGTASDVGDEVALSVLRQLGPDVAQHIRVFSCDPTPGEQQRDGSGDGSGMAAPDVSTLLADARDQAKMRGACEFIKAIRTNPESALQIGLDTNLMNTGTRRLVSLECLSAISAMLGVPMASSLFLGANSRLLQQAVAAGMVGVAMPRRLAQQGAFPNVKAKFEGYGIGYATWPRLRSLVSN